jgi:hypothetical protein
MELPVRYQEKGQKIGSVKIAEDVLRRKLLTNAFAIRTKTLHEMFASVGCGLYRFILH